MAIYEYDCLSCGLRSEVRRPMSQSQDPYTCECGSDHTKRLISSPAVHMDTTNFRGSGRSEMDKIIGASAERRWEQHKSEQAKRDKVRHDTGERAIGRTGDGQYAPVPHHRQEQRQAAYEKFDYAKRTGTKVEHD